MERTNQSEKFGVGSKLPAFELPNVDGRTLGDAYLRGAKLALVVFSCNHCPYVKGSEKMLIETVHQFEGQGLRTVAISANDSEQYPEDSFEQMKVKAREINLPYPYLYDETQEVAKKFDAACTPECYLFDTGQSLIFHGAISDNPKDATAVKKNYLALAISQALEGLKPSPAFVHPIGCSIKWRR